MRVLLTAGLAVSGVLFVGFLLFVAMVPREPDRTGLRADAIVVLTGGEDRLAEGARLLASGRGDRLLITGVHEETSRRDILAKLDLVSQELSQDLDCCIDLDRAALDTRGNAQQTRRWADRHGYRSLIVVTANYHMPRSLMEFARTMPERTLIAHPVFPSGFSPTADWQWAIAGRLLVGEYLKFLASYVMGRR